jgi:hypothetical protein
MLKCNRKASGHDCYADVDSKMDLDDADLLPSIHAEDLNVDQTPAHSSQQVLGMQDHLERDKDPSAPVGFSCETGHTRIVPLDAGSPWSLHESESVATWKCNQEFSSDLSTESTQSIVRMFLRTLGGSSDKDFECIHSTVDLQAEQRQHKADTCRQRDLFLRILS